MGSEDVCGHSLGSVLLLAAGGHWYSSTISKPSFSLCSVIKPLVCSVTASWWGHLSLDHSTWRSRVLPLCLGPGIYHPRKGNLKVSDAEARRIKARWVLISPWNVVILLFTECKAHAMKIYWILVQVENNFCLDCNSVAGKFSSNLASGYIVYLY